MVESKPYIIKIKRNGELLWARLYEDVSIQNIIDIGSINDSILTGNCNKTEDKIFLMIVDNNGDIHEIKNPEETMLITDSDNSLKLLEFNNNSN